MTRRLVRVLPLLFAALLANLFDLGAIGFGVALGIAAFVALLLARRPMPFRFGALSLAGAVAFGFVTAVLASLYGLPVQDLMASTDASHLMPKSLGIVAVLLAVLGAACLAWGSIVDNRADDNN